MINVNVLYPNNPDSRFDSDYYLTKHLPMVQQKMGAALKGMRVERGLAGAMPGTPAPFVMSVALMFDSVDSFQQAFGPHATEILADIGNYTDIQPTVQVAEILGA